MIESITKMRQKLQVMLEHGVALVAGSLVLMVLWQVTTRYVLGKPSSWTDEGSTVLLVWMSLLGTAVGFARRSHLGLDYLAEKLPWRGRERLRALAFVVIGLFAAVVMIYGGAGLAGSAFRTGQLMPALQMRRGWFYLPLPIGGAMVLLAAFEGFLVSLAASRAGTPPGSSPQTVEVLD